MFEWNATKELKADVQGIEEVFRKFFLGEGYRGFTIFYDAILQKHCFWP